MPRHSKARSGDCPPWRVPLQGQADTNNLIANRSTRARGPCGDRSEFIPGKTVTVTLVQLLRCRKQWPEEGSWVSDGEEPLSCNTALKKVSAL